MTPAEVSEVRLAPDIARAVTVFLLVFAVYFVGYSRTLPPNADEMIDFGLAQSIAKWQTTAINQISTVGPNPEELGAGDHRYSKYGPLQAVLAAPLFLIAQHLPIGAVDTVLLLNHLLTAMTAGLFYLLVRRLGYRPWLALALTGVVAFGTPLWVESKRFFGEPTMTLTVVAAVYTAYVAATTGRRRWLLASGFAFGAAIAAKYVDGILLLPIPLYLGWMAAFPVGAEARSSSWFRPGGMTQWKWPRDANRRRIIVTLLWFGAGALPIIAALAYYDLARFGSVLETGYAHREGFSTPVWVGSVGFLLSPGKSIFVYTPLFLLLPFWGRRFFRRFEAFGAVVAAIVAFHIIVLGTWLTWWGAWAWGPRLIMPIMPLLVLFLAEGLRATKRRGVQVVAATLGTLSVVIQIIGLSVDHKVYLVQLIPLNYQPDILTLYDFRYSPILHQIPLMTREFLDFAWIQRTGPNPVDLPPLLAALGSVVAAIVGFALVSRTRGWRWWLPTLAMAGLFVAGGTIQALRIYYRQVPAEIAEVAAELGAAPDRTAVIQLIPGSIVPYSNWQKRELPELAWIEEPNPEPIVVRRIERLAADQPWIWTVTETAAKSPSNGVEALLDRSFVQMGSQTIGPFRLLRYATRPELVHFVPTSSSFSSGVQLAGFATPNGRPRRGRALDVVLHWRATGDAPRPDYTVFVHLVDGNGKIVAQKDDPPANGYAPTSGWQPNQNIYDDHTILVPADAPARMHLVQVGLYLPSNGRRVPIVGTDGKPIGDVVTLDLDASG